MKKVYDKATEAKLFNNREEKQNSFSKIMNMGLTLMDLRELIYYCESRYIKSFLDRKLYANRSEKKMDFNTFMDDDELKETEDWKNSLFKSLFPEFN